jgi:hypothetical protein
LITELEASNVRAYFEKESLLRAVQCSYLKHHCGSEEIGWDELSEILSDALWNAMGPDACNEWCEQEKIPIPKPLKHVPWKRVQEVIDEIKAEIFRRARHPNLGKKGCVARLEKLRPQERKET